MILLLAYFGLAGARRSQVRWIIAMLVLGITRVDELRGTYQRLADAEGPVPLLVVYRSRRA